MSFDYRPSLDLRASNYRIKTEMRDKQRKKTIVFASVLAELLRYRTTIWH